MADHFERGGKHNYEKSKQVQADIEKLNPKVNAAANANEDPEEADLIALRDKQKEKSFLTSSKKALDDRAAKLRNDRRTSGILNMSTSGEDHTGHGWHRMGQRLHPAAMCERHY